MQEGYYVAFHAQQQQAPHLLQHLHQPLTQNQIAPHQQHAPLQPPLAGHLPQPQFAAEAHQDSMVPGAASIQQMARPAESGESSSNAPLRRAKRSRAEVEATGDEAECARASPSRLSHLPPSVLNAQMGQAAQNHALRRQTQHPHQVHQHCHRQQQNQVLHDSLARHQRCPEQQQQQQQGVHHEQHCPHRAQQDQSAFAGRLAAVPRPDLTGPQSFAPLDPHQQLSQALKTCSWILSGRGMAAQPPFNQASQAPEQMWQGQQTVPSQDGLGLSLRSSGGALGAFPATLHQNGSGPPAMAPGHQHIRADAWGGQQQLPQHHLQPYPSLPPPAVGAPRLAASPAAAAAGPPTGMPSAHGPGAVPMQPHEGARQLQSAHAPAPNGHAHHVSLGTHLAAEPGQAKLQQAWVAASGTNGAKRARAAMEPILFKEEAADSMEGSGENSDIEEGAIDASPHQNNGTGPTTRAPGPNCAWGSPATEMAGLWHSTGAADAGQSALVDGSAQFAGQSSGAMATPSVAHASGRPAGRQAGTGPGQREHGVQMSPGTAMPGALHPSACPPPLSAGMRPRSASDKRRRNGIREKLEQLRTAIPDGHSRMTTECVLSAALSYIHQLSCEVNSLKAGKAGL